MVLEKTLALVTEVYGYVELVGKVQELFTQDGLLRLLMELGCTDYDAAIQHLKNARRSGKLHGRYPSQLCSSSQPTKNLFAPLQNRAYSLSLVI